MTNPATKETEMETTSANVNTKLAYDRTRLAYERTLMAWVRTATSLISFGFTIYKFFHEFHKAPEGAVRQGLFGAREFGLLMIIIGVVVLVLATVQHHLEMRRLRAQGAEYQRSLSMILASLISVLGVLALLAVIFRQ
jgi:putative membrane protein